MYHPLEIKYIKKGFNINWTHFPFIPGVHSVVVDGAGCGAVGGAVSGVVAARLSHTAFGSVAHQDWVHIGVLDELNLQRNSVGILGAMLYQHVQGSAQSAEMRSPGLVNFVTALATTSAWLCLQYSRNLAQAF